MWNVRGGGGGVASGEKWHTFRVTDSQTVLMRVSHGDPVVWSTLFAATTLASVSAAQRGN